VITLADIFQALSGSSPAGASMIISEASVDSRQVIPGGLFIALTTDRPVEEQVHEAFSRGAHLALVDQDFSSPQPFIRWEPGESLAEVHLPQDSFILRVPSTLDAMIAIANYCREGVDLRVIAITGSSGKTTTRHLLMDVLSQRFRVLRYAHANSQDVDIPLTLLRLGKGHQCMIVELDLHSPEAFTRLVKLAKPHIGVVTNISPYYQGEACEPEGSQLPLELLRALPADGYAILNYDDPCVRLMHTSTQARVFYYGLDPLADLWADDIQGYGLEGIRFRVHFSGESFYLRVPLFGRHSVHTVLRSAAVGLAEGLGWQEIIKGLQQGHSQLRLVAVHSQSGALLLDDTYSASTESTLAALNLLDELDGRKIAVLGDLVEPGPNEIAAHHMVGMRAAEVCDSLLAVGERGRLIADAARDFGLASQAFWVPVVSEAIDMLKSWLHEGDVVLVKGSRNLQLDRVVSALEVSS
jgi:UDP-N-acetylmuramoyl-tripeptide--D-alanyl-D-alanine ligase